MTGWLWSLGLLLWALILTTAWISIARRADREAVWSGGTRVGEERA